MKFLTGVILFCLSALTAAEINCFDRVSLKCVAEEYRKHLSNTNFCRTSPSSTKCFFDAAVQCQTGFEEIARTAYLKQVEICTEGSVSNKAVKNDPFCGFDTLVETRKCDMEKEGGLCKHLSPDEIKECQFRTFTKCTIGARRAFQGVYEAFVELMRKVCKQPRMSEIIAVFF